MSVEPRRLKMNLLNRDCASFPRVELPKWNSRRGTPRVALISIVGDWQHEALNLAELKLTLNHKITKWVYYLSSVVSVLPKARTAYQKHILDKADRFFTKNWASAEDRVTAP